MNTTEVKIKNPIKDFDDFFKRMTQQFLNYEKIEGIDNWKEYDFSIDCSEDQMKFKDMLQIRFIEELTEASEALQENNKEHFKEEITDAINFFMSAYIMLGTDFKELSNIAKWLPKNKSDIFLPKEIHYSTSCWLLTDKVGRLCNLLKNRPWSQSNYLVSMLDFNTRLSDLWDNFWCFIANLNITKETLFDMIERKIEVNKIRISTGY